MRGRSSEALRSLGVEEAAMIKLGAAFVMLAVLAALSWTTLSDPRFRALTLVVLGGCAVKIWIEHKRRLLEEQDGRVGRE